MNNKGFYLLQPEKAKHFEAILEAIRHFERYGIMLCFPKKEKDQNLIPFTVMFKTVEKEGEFFVRMTMRTKNKGINFEKLIPNSKKSPKAFFNLVREYLDQKLKKEKLTELLTEQGEHNKALVLMFGQLKKLYLKKKEAVDSEYADEASRLFELQIKFLEKILYIVTQQRGFDWVTIFYVDDILMSE